MKPTVFNYQEYERVVEENKKLNAEVADLRIRCRIADGDKRDCKSCKHNKPDGCSRWDCEYEPAKSDLISRADAIDGFYNVKVHEEDCTEYDIGYNDGIDYAISKLSVMPSALPSADAVEVVRCKDCKYGEYRQDFDDYECGVDGCGLVYDADFYCSDGERREP